MLIRILSLLKYRFLNSIATLFASIQFLEMKKSENGTVFTTIEKLEVFQEDKKAKDFENFVPTPLF